MLLHVLSLFSGAVIGGFLWVECAIVIGGAFLSCPVRPLLAALSFIAMFTLAFRGLVFEHPAPAAVFLSAVALPFVIHMLFALC